MELVVYHSLELARIVLASMPFEEFVKACALQASLMET
jgi:hypothetical protein